MLILLDVFTRENYRWCFSVPNTRHEHTTKACESRTSSAADSSKRRLMLSREKGIIPLLEDIEPLFDEIPFPSLSVVHPSASLCIGPRGPPRPHSHTWTEPAPLSPRSLTRRRSRTGQGFIDHLRSLQRHGLGDEVGRAAIPQHRHDHRLQRRELRWGFVYRPFLFPDALGE
jgi:hypothetical protein